MFIDYLCTHCCFTMDIKPNQQAINDRGQKMCADCGWSGEKRMHIRTDLDESGKAWVQHDERKQAFQWQRLK